MHLLFRYWLNASDGAWGEVYRSIWPVVIGWDVDAQEGTPRERLLGDKAEQPLRSRLHAQRMVRRGFRLDATPGRKTLPREYDAVFHAFSIALMCGGYNRAVIEDSDGMAQVRIGKNERVGGGK